jgi:hypothetical protein
LRKAGFDNQLFKTSKALPEFAARLRWDDLLPTHLPDKIKKPELHGKAFGRSFTRDEVAEVAADKVGKEQQGARQVRHAQELPPRVVVTKIIVPATPPLPPD